MNTKNEVKYAVGMVERRREEAETIGNAESARQARQTYKSMSACVREVKKHNANILLMIDDNNAGESGKVLDLLILATDWQTRARADLVRWGVTESEIANMDEGMVI